MGFLTFLRQHLASLLVGLLLASLPMLPPVINGYQQLADVLPRQLAVSLLLLGAYCINTAWAVPRLLLTGRRYTYVLLITLLVVVTSSVVPLVGPRPRNVSGPVEGNLSPAARRQQEANLPARRPIGFFAVMLASTIIMVGIGTQVTVLRHEQRQGMVRQQLEQEKQQVELSYLKQQLNPHFFFNTLNNIYALTEVDVEKAQLALYKLSRIMRYVLYQTQEASVLLSQELNFLQDYVSLMQLRMTANMQVDIVVPETLDDRTIAPLLLLPLLENAFKYGVSTSQPAVISIRLGQAGSLLTLETRNQIFAPRTTLVEGGGIGLANTRRRLALLYPNRHELRIVERTADDKFETSLTIDLTA